MAIGDGFSPEEQARWEQECRERWAEEDAIAAWRINNNIFEVRDSDGFVAETPLYTEFGSWKNSSAKVNFHPYFEGAGSRFIDYNDFDGTNPGSDYAILAPAWPQAGSYEIYAAWPRGANASDVKYTVDHAGGQDIVYLDQITGTNANQWVSIGTFNFDQGRSHNGKLTISEEDVSGRPSTGWGRRVYIDSFRARLIT